MTETEKKALALVNAVCAEWEVSPAFEDDMDGSACFAALTRAVEQHEAFKREVSDAVEGYTSMVGLDPKRYFARFIIAKPDPLVEVIATALREGSPFDEDGSHDYTAEAKVIAAAIRASGLEVRKIGEGE